MESGVTLDTSEYNESLATCRTNIKCLEVVIETLQSQAAAVTNVTGDDINHVIDVIEKWQSLESIAHERLVQSQQLNVLYKDMMALQTTLDEVDTVLGKQDFTDVITMETVIFTIQQRRDALPKQRVVLESIGRGVQHFENNNEDVNMNKFMREVENLESYLEDITVRTHGRLSELQNALLSWYDLQEKLRELEHSLDTEQEHIYSMELAQQLITLNEKRGDLDGAQLDLKKLECEFKPLNTRLQFLRALHQDIALYLHRTTELHLRAHLGTIENQLIDLKTRQQTMVVKLEQRLAQKAVRETAQPESENSLSSAARREPEARSWLLRMLRVALPIKLLALAIFIAYLLYPEWFDSMGLVINPELNYVRGPPPT